VVVGITTAATENQIKNLKKKCRVEKDDELIFREICGGGR